MHLRSAIAVAGLVAIALPLAVLASQPQVKVTELAVTPAAFEVLLRDPRAPVELSIEQVTGFATLDVDADPLGAE